MSGHFDPSGDSLLDYYILKARDYPSPPPIDRPHEPPRDELDTSFAAPRRSAARRENEITPGRRVGPTRISVKTHFASDKNRRAIVCESNLERDFMITLEWNPAVESYVEQPNLDIRYATPKGARPYTADALVYYKNGETTLFEVKPRSKLLRDWGKLHRRLLAGCRFAAERQWRFKIMTDHEIRSRRTSNLVFLYRYRHLALADVAREAVLRAVGGGALPLCALAERLTTDEQPASTWYSAMWTMIARGDLRVDLRSRLTAATLVYGP